MKELHDVYKDYDEIFREMYELYMEMDLSGTVAEICDRRKKMRGYHERDIRF